MKYVVIPVITGATGVVTEGLKKSLEAMPGERSIDSLHKTAVLGQHTQYGKCCSVKLEALT
jgi:hypothetical protein